MKVYSIIALLGAASAVHITKELDSTSLDPTNPYSSMEQLDINEEVV